MVPSETLFIFFSAAVLLALAPGPDNLFVFTQATLRGSRAGLAVTVGLCTGLLVHTAAVVLGVAAIFQASAAAFTVVKLFGAAYLFYLAWQAYHASTLAVPAQTISKGSLGTLYRRGIVMNITNPKVSIFFLAFLPQFADPARGNISLQLAMLGVVFILAALLTFSGISLVAGAIGGRVHRSARVQKVMHRATALLFTGLAVRLATAQR